LLRAFGREHFVEIGFGTGIEQKTKFTTIWVISKMPDANFVLFVLKYPLS
jgi:hypothetical protein